MIYDKDTVSRKGLLVPKWGISGLVTFKVNERALGGQRAEETGFLAWA